nr:MAG TPA: hypothetical protein [Myoviridae sp. ctTS62]
MDSTFTELDSSSISQTLSLIRNTYCTNRYFLHLSSCLNFSLLL